MRSLFSNKPKNYHCCPKANNNANRQYISWVHQILKVVGVALNTIQENSCIAAGMLVM
jgi:hypothetical protein